MLTKQKKWFLKNCYYLKLCLVFFQVMYKMASLWTLNKSLELTKNENEIIYFLFKKFFFMDLKVKWMYMIL